MNKEWLEKINMTLEERVNLERWCENIGYKRYESICNSIIEKTKYDTVNYDVLKAIAKYDRPAAGGFVGISQPEILAGK